MNEANCEYFERPHYGDTEIKCEKCKDGFEEPYCSASGYQGLNGGQWEIKTKKIMIDLIELSHLK